MAQKVLMCKPTHFSIDYEINPWMNFANQVDNRKALVQWEALVGIYRKLGVRVELIEPRPHVPDLIFTANAGLVYKDLFFPSNFRFPERQPERRLFVKWFRDCGYKVVNLSKEIVFEGGGDALFCGSKLYLGSGFRSDRKVKDFISRHIKDVEIVPLGLSNPYFYHLDTCFSPLPDGSFIYYPDAFDDESRLTLERLKGHEITEEMCINYGCNLTFVGESLVTGFADNSLKVVAKELGLTIIQTDMTEFIKSGGGTRCLTLFI